MLSYCQDKCVKVVFNMADNKTVAVNIRLPQVAGEGIKALADINGVTVSDYIRALITADLKKNEEFLEDYQRKLEELRSKMKG